MADEQDIIEVPEIESEFESIFSSSPKDSSEEVIEVPFEDDPTFTEELLTNLAIGQIVEDADSENLIVEYPEFKGQSLGEYKVLTEAWALQQEENFARANPEVYSGNKDAIGRMLSEEADQRFRENTNVTSSWAGDAFNRFGKGVVTSLTDMAFGVAKGYKKGVDLLAQGVGVFSEEGELALEELSQDMDENIQSNRELRDDTIDLMFPTDVARDEDFSSQVSQGVGQGITQLTSAVVFTPAFLTGLVGQIDASAQESYDKVLEITGGDKSKASEAYKKTAVGYGLSSIPELIFFKGLGKAILGKTSSKFTGKFGDRIAPPRGNLKKLLNNRFTKTAAAGAASEGVQEGGEEATRQAAIETSVTDEDLNFIASSLGNLKDESVWRAAGLGATVGSIIGVGGEAAVSKSLRRGYGDIFTGKGVDLTQLNREIELLDFNVKDLASSRELVTKLETELKSVADPELKGVLESLISDQKTLQTKIQADLDLQGTELGSKVKDAAQAEIDDILEQKSELEVRRQELINKDLADLDTLSALESEIAELDNRATSIRETKLSTQAQVASQKTEISEKNLDRVVAKQAGDKATAKELATELELERAETGVDSSKSTELSLDAKKELDEISQKRREIKVERKNILKRSKESKQTLKTLDDEAVKLTKDLQDATNKRDAFQVLVAGDSRLVVSKNVDKDAADFAGNILAGFGISKPVAIVTNSDIDNRVTKDLFSQEGAPTGKKKKSKENEDLPSFSQLTNSFSIKLNNGKLTPRNAETIAHETGHVVAEDLAARDENIVPLIERAYNTFLRSDPSADSRASKQILPQRKAEAGIVQVTPSQKEWVADNVARYIQNKNLDAKSPVEKFFKDLATSIRSIYNDYIGSTSLKVDPTVEAFLNDHFNSERSIAFLKNRGTVSSKINEDDNEKNTPPLGEETKSSKETKGEQQSLDFSSNPEPSQETKSSKEDEIKEETIQEKEEVSEDFERFSRNQEDFPSISSKEAFGLANETSRETSLLDIYVPESDRLSESKLFTSLTKKDPNIDESVKKVIEENNASKLPVISGQETVKAMEALVNKWGVQKMYDIFVDPHGTGVKGELEPRYRIALGAVLYKTLNNQIKEAKAVNNKEVVRKLEKDADIIFKKGVNLARTSGREVQLFSYWRAEPTPARILQRVLEFNAQNLEDSGLPAKELNEDTQQEILNLAEELLNIDERAVTLQAKKMQEIVDAIVEQEGRDWPDTLINYYRASLLINPDTLLSNPIYSGLNIGFKTASGILGAKVLGKIPSGVMTSQLREAGLEITKLKTKQAFRGDVSTESLGDKYDMADPKNFTVSEFEALRKLEAEGVSPFSPRYLNIAAKAFFGKFSDFVRDLMMTGDMFFSSTGMETYLRYAEASEIAKSNPEMSAEDIGNKISERLWLNDARAKELTQDAERAVMGFFGGVDKVRQLRSTEVGKKRYQNELDNTYLDMLNAKRDSELLRQASLFSSHATLTSDPVGVPAALSGTLRGIKEAVTGLTGLPLVEFNIPFVNTIANLLGFTADVAGIGLLRAYTGYNTILPDKLFGKTGYSRFFGKKQKIGEFDRIALGTMPILSWGVGLALMEMSGPKDENDKNPYFDIVGHIHRDAAVRRDFTSRTGMDQYTIKIGNTLLDYSETPLIFVLGTLASYRDLNRFEDKKYLNKTDFDRMLYLGSIASNALNNSTFVGESLKFFAEVTGRIEGIDKASGWEKLAERTGNNLAGLIPLAGGGAKRLINDIIGAPSINRPLLKRDEVNNPKSSIIVGLQYGTLYGAGTDIYPYRDWFGKIEKKTPYERLAVGVRRFIRPIEKVEKHWEIVRDKDLRLQPHSFTQKFLPSLVTEDIANSRAHQLSEAASGVMTPAETDFYLKEFGKEMKTFVLEELANSDESTAELQDRLDDKRKELKREIQIKMLEKFRNY